MATSVSLPMALLSSSATLINRCHIKLDHAMPLVEKATALMDLDAISCIITKIQRQKLSHYRSLGRFYIKSERKMEADY